jgi:predicted O-methyltransferase YrrM
MIPLCILYLHHADDDLTRYHHGLIRYTNPTTPIVPLTFNKGLGNAIRMPASLIHGEPRAEWHNVDQLVYRWFGSDSRIDAERYLILESDTHCNIPVRDFYATVWDMPASGALVQTLDENTRLGIFAGVPDPPSYNGAILALTPVCGTMLSYDALSAISPLAQDSLYASLFSEVRLGTMLGAAGFSPVPIFPSVNKYISWARRVPIAPGIWHAVKKMYLGRIHEPRSFDPAQSLDVFKSKYAKAPNPANINHLTAFDEEEAIGPVQREEAMFLFSLIRMLRPRILVEFGFARGHSALNFLMAMDYEADLYSYDVDVASASLAEKYASEYSGFHFLHKSQETFSPVDVGGRLIDFVFIDAAHELDLNQKTFTLLLPSLAPNAILAVHDTGTWNRHHFLSEHFNFANERPNQWLNLDEFQHQRAERQFVNWVADAFSDFQVIHLHSLNCVRHGITLLQRGHTLPT